MKRMVVKFFTLSLLLTYHISINGALQRLTNIKNNSLTEAKVIIKDVHDALNGGKPFVAYEGMVYAGNEIVPKNATPPTDVFFPWMYDNMIARGDQNKKCIRINVHDNVILQKDSSNDPVDKWIIISPEGKTGEVKLGDKISLVCNKKILKLKTSFGEKEILKTDYLLLRAAPSSEANNVDLIDKPHANERCSETQWTILNQEGEGDKKTEINFGDLITLKSNPDPGDFLFLSAAPSVKQNRSLGYAEKWSFKSASATPKKGKISFGDIVKVESYKYPSEFLEAIPYQEYYISQGTPSGRKDAIWMLTPTGEYIELVKEVGVVAGDVGLVIEQNGSIHINAQIEYERQRRIKELNKTLEEVEKSVGEIIEYLIEIQEEAAKELLKK